MEFLCVMIPVVFVLLVVLIWQLAAKQRDGLKAAFEEYQQCLEQLKGNPNDPELRQEALSLGRTYSNLSRNRTGVAIFDEVALKNDIDAACAGAVSVQDRSIEDRLTKLEQLFSVGHITATEYQRRRQQLIDEL
jgi:hypothetical protein